MNSRHRFSPVDHHLVARVQACITGSNAHRLHALLGNYYELCLLREEDQALGTRVELIERELRAVCRTSGMTRAIAREDCVQN